MFSMYHNGVKVEWKSAGELGQKAAHLGIINPYDPDTLEYGYFQEAKSNEKEKIRQQSELSRSNKERGE